MFGFKSRQEPVGACLLVEAQGKWIDESEAREKFGHEIKLFKLSERTGYRTQKTKCIDQEKRNKEKRAEFHVTSSFKCQPTREAYRTD